MTDIAIALNRFGLGARPDEIPPADARQWLKSQLRVFETRPQSLAGLPSRVDIATSLADYFEDLRAMGRKAPGNAEAIDAGDASGDDVRKSARQFIRRSARDHYLAEVGARTRTALISDTPFVERLVHFWANHFAVSADKLAVIGLAGMLEFEAIRPHVLGRFSDMLIAVEQHPAMLLYLDQAQSVGPDSALGARAAAQGRRKVGLNENLAREILELHTLGVRTGYTQADITEFARALTGWTVAGLGRGPGARIAGVMDEPGTFAFVDRLHQPGSRTIMGKRYDEIGEGQAKAVLRDLAIHPATARHIATKLARHFVADSPPPALVDRLSAVFLKDSGDLSAIYAALIDAPEAWSPRSAKFKTPWEWGVSALRATGTLTIPDQGATVMMAQLGQPVWRPGSPAGFDDIAASWVGPEALVRRVEVAERIAARTMDAIDARALAPRLFPGVLGNDTAETIARADSPGQGLALLLVSPEFLRR